MPKYTCPECETILKTAQPVPAGKRVKCTACGTVFAPSDADEPEDEPVKPAKAKSGTAKPKAKPKPAAAPAPKPPAEENSYALQQTEETDQPEKVDFTRVKDKFAKSKRGPAIEIVRRPAKFLLIVGVLEAFVAIGVVVVGVWPFLFSEEQYDTTEQVMWILGGMFIFVWGGLIAQGASEMQDLGSYNWAMTGAILGLNFFPVGIWCITTLRDEKVLAGFAEAPPD